MPALDARRRRGRASDRSEGHALGGQPHRHHPGSLRRRRSTLGVPRRPSGCQERSNHTIYRRFFTKGSCKSSPGAHELIRISPYFSANGNSPLSSDLVGSSGQAMIPPPQHLLSSIRVDLLQGSGVTRLLYRDGPGRPHRGTSRGGAKLAGPVLACRLLRGLVRRICPDARSRSARALPAAPTAGAAAAAVLAALAVHGPDGTRGTATARAPW